MSDAAATSLSQEVAIVWVEGWNTVDAKYDYVRWMYEKTRNRTGQPRGSMRAGRIVGYAELDESAEPTEPSRRYRRRVFYVKDNDRSEPGGQYQDATPHEAVDPRTVRPGVHGQLTDRARAQPVEPLARPPRPARDCRASAPSAPSYMTQGILTWDFARAGKGRAGHGRPWALLSPGAPGVD